jgi:hypothetical protein
VARREAPVRALTSARRVRKLGRGGAPRGVGCVALPSLGRAVALAVGAPPGAALWRGRVRGSCARRVLKRVQCGCGWPDARSCAARVNVRSRLCGEGGVCLCVVVRDGCV